LARAIDDLDRKVATALDSSSVASAIQTLARPRARSAPRRALSTIAFALLLGWAASAWAGDYEGRPTCDYCAMFITEKHFGGRLTTTADKTLVFDANECLVAFSLSKIPAPEIRERRTVNYTDPSEWLDVKRAWFLQSDKRPSPMAVNLSAYASREEAERAKSALGGEVFDWDGVVKLIRRRWFREKVD
jgi:copper chaperone NosL